MNQVTGYQDSATTYSTFSLKLRNLSRSNIFWSETISSCSPADPHPHQIGLFVHPRVAVRPTISELGLFLCPIDCVTSCLYGPPDTYTWAILAPGPPPSYCRRSLPPVDREEEEEEEERRPFRRSKTCGLAGNDGATNPEPLKGFARAPVANVPGSG